jgi:plastocyanin
MKQMHKYLALSLFAVLLITPISTQFAHATTWYPGQGLKQGDYYRYDICWTDWHNCTPIQIDFWVKNQTSDGTGWNLEFLAIDGSIVQKGTVSIGTETPDPTYADPNISDYSGVYKNTISWLDAFSSKDNAQTLGSPSWGRTGSVGGQSVSSMGQQQVTVQGGTFQTWVLGWHKGIDNQIWIDPSLSFPVKAIVYTDVTSGVPPPDYKLELLQQGNSPTEPSFLNVISSGLVGSSAQCPVSDMINDSTHGSQTTDSGSMILEYRYSPSNPHLGCPMEWRISFEKNFDPSQKYSNVQYDIFTVDEQGHQVDSISQDSGRSALFAPVGDDDRTIILKGTTPTTHFIINVFGTGAQGMTPDQTLAGLIKIDVNTQPSFVVTSGTVTNMNNTTTTSATPIHISINIPQGASTESNNLTYNPKDTWVTPDSTVTWTNNDNKPHTITSGSAQAGPDGKFDSGLIQPGQNFTYTFTGEGTYNYFDQVSPWLSGSVTVNANAVPEFPLSAILIMTIVVGTGILFTRLRSGLAGTKF